MMTSDDQSSLDTLTDFANSLDNFLQTQRGKPVERDNIPVDNELEPLQIGQDCASIVAALSC